MSLSELGALAAAARGSEATPSRRSPVGGPRLGPVLGVELDYAMTEPTAVDLFRLAGFLRRQLKARHLTVAEAKKAARWPGLGPLLAITEARRPTMATLERFGDVVGATPSGLLLLAAEVPHAIAPESEYC